MQLKTNSYANSLQFEPKSYEKKRLTEVSKMEVNPCCNSINNIRISNYDPNDSEKRKYCKQQVNNLDSAHRASLGQDEHDHAHSEVPAHNGLMPLHETVSSSRRQTLMKSNIPQESSTMNSPQNTEKLVRADSLAVQRRKNENSTFRVIFPFMRSYSGCSVNSDAEKTAACSETDTSTTFDEVRSVCDMDKSMDENTESKDEFNHHVESPRSTQGMPSFNSNDTEQQFSPNSHMNLNSRIYTPTYLQLPIPRLSHDYSQGLHNNGLEKNQKKSTTLPRSILRRSSFSSNSSSQSIASTDSSGKSKDKRSGVFLSEIVKSKIALDKITNADPIGQKSSSTPLLLNRFRDNRRTASTGVLSGKIRFDPQVWVHEFKKTTDDLKDLTWWSASEMEAFKDEAIARIRKNQTVFSGSGTGRVVYAASQQRAFYNHPALGIDGDEDDIRENVKQLQKTSDAELKTILIVDAHDIFLRLFSKSFKQMIPNAEISVAKSISEALQLIEKRKNKFPITQGGTVHGFDLILAEERLIGCAYGRAQNPLQENHPQASQSSIDSLTIMQEHANSGSALFKKLTLEEATIKKEWLPSSKKNFRFSLFIGVSAHFKDDEWKLKKAGASFVWGKPPPRMSYELHSTLVKAIIEKRNHNELTIEQ